MRAISQCILAISVFSVSANYGLAQRGIPIRAPVFRPAPAPIFSPMWAGTARRSDSETDWLPIILGIVGVAGLAGVGWFAVRAWKNRASAAMRIRVVRIPAGEAPENIRREWVGVELRLSQGEKGPRALGSVGVVSNVGPQMTFGYVVDGRHAVDQLASHSPDAADWWRTNAKHVLCAATSCNSRRKLANPWRFDTTPK